ncbi:hypothetical protein PHOSAC3_150304 [Mesotoga infera]|nr:hypothetical protein PHOSAC3_150304 [Mesotoga infera]
MFLPNWASQAITKDWTYLASPASLILTNNQGRLFTALSGTQDRDDETSP